MYGLSDQQLLNSVRYIGVIFFIIVVLHVSVMCLGKCISENDKANLKTYISSGNPEERANIRKEMKYFGLKKEIEKASSQF